MNSIFEDSPTATLCMIMASYSLDNSVDLFCSPLLSKIMIREDGREKFKTLIHCMENQSRFFSSQENFSRSHATGLDNRLHLSSMPEEISVLEIWPRNVKAFEESLKYT